MRLDKLKRAAVKPVIELPDEDWRAIEAAIGRGEPDPYFRLRLARFVQLVLAHRSPSFGEVGGPQLPAVRKRLRKLNADAKRLTRTLTGLQAQNDRSAEQALNMVVSRSSSLLEKRYPKLAYAIVPEDLYADWPEDWKPEPSLERWPPATEELAVSIVDYLATASESALKSLGKSTGGTPKDTELEELICTLAVAYRDETGKTPSVTWDEFNQRYTGAFFEFVSACCRAFTPRYGEKTNMALGKAILRALKHCPASLRVDKTTPR